MRSVREIFRSHAFFDAEGKHTWGTDRESNHSYGSAYESLFAKDDDNLCLYKLHSDRRSCDKCGSDTYHFAHCPDSKMTRHSVRLMLEIGVADGNSLLAWREVFPQALIVGMDLNPPCFSMTVSRVEFHLADQRLCEDCDRVAKDRQFDLIVDDASHQPADILVCLLWMWPHLRPGGIYVIEDLEPHLCDKFAALLPATILDSTGPFSDNEPLIVLRKT